MPVSDRSIGHVSGTAWRAVHGWRIALVDVVAFNLGIIVERLGGIETRHHGLRERIDRWMDR